MWELLDLLWVTNSWPTEKQVNLLSASLCLAILLSFSFAMATSDWHASLLQAKSLGVEGPVEYGSYFQHLSCFFSTSLSSSSFQPRPRAFSLLLARNFLDVYSYLLPALYLFYSYISMLCFVLCENSPFLVF